MKVEQRFPAGPDVEVDELLAELRPEDRLRVGDERVVDFLVRFARKLLAPAVARRYPELASLGFFLRRGEIAKALSTLDRRDGALRFPRGLVFHVPPANVDTIFVYSWALSALAGNPNVVRISSRSAGAAETVLEALNDALAEADPIIARTQRMITYGRDDAVTAALSAACELRVIWGGDRSVAELRKHPLAPNARDLTFPDRASFAAISVAGWRAATPEQRREAVTGFYNDSYWFDQAACSSPRTLFWVGEPDDDASAEFRALLGDVVAGKNFVVDAAMAVQKRVSAYGVAAEGHATRVRFDGNAVATLDLARPLSVPREWLGVGTFPQATLSSLAELGAVVQRKDQTLSVFGFGREEIVEFVGSLGGRGIDRVVPFGSALSFAAVWDGYDLLAEFSRLTTVTV
ncbi:acyl-CoA reductase [Actinosynnema sp. NPDC051121]